jgi:hypothetical protein
MPGVVGFLGLDPCMQRFSELPGLCLPNLQAQVLWQLHDPDLDVELG